MRACVGRLAILRRKQGRRPVVATGPRRSPGTCGRARLDDQRLRLERHHARLVDDLDAAHLRIQWTERERHARLAMNTADARALEDVGILAAHTDELEDRRLITRRRIQPAALAALQTLTTEALRNARPPADEPEGRQ